MLGSGVDHRGRRLAAARAARAAAGRVLPPRVVRQVRALPRGHELDREDARADRRGRGHADGPRHPRARSRATSSATACACSATRWRCRSASMLKHFRAEFEEHMETRPRRGATSRSSSRSARPSSPPCRKRGRCSGPPRAELDHLRDRRQAGARAGGRDARRRRQARRRRDPLLLLRAEARASRSAPAACAWSRSRASRSSRPRAPRRCATAWS